MDDNDDLDYVEEDYYAALNVPRTVSIVAAPIQSWNTRTGFVICETGYIN